MRLKIGCLYQININETPIYLSTEIKNMRGRPENEWYLNNVYLAKPGIALLANIFYSSSGASYDICQLLFNNKNGVRYAYRYELNTEYNISKKRI